MAGSVTRRIDVYGIEPQYAVIKNRKTSAGRFISERDVDGAAPVCMLGFKLKQQLFGGEDAIGQRLNLGGRRLTVVGVGTEFNMTFVNDDDIYLHDTPTKSLFAKADRALSNGCVRLEAAPRFARWLLFGRDPVAAAPDLPEQHVKLPQSVPVYLTYLTAQPQNGKVTYLTDVYGLDKVGTKVAAR